MTDLHAVCTIKVLYILSHTCLSISKHCMTHTPAYDHSCLFQVMLGPVDNANISATARGQRPSYLIQISNT